MSQLIAVPTDTSGLRRSYLIEDGSKTFELWWEFSIEELVPASTRPSTTLP